MKKRLITAFIMLIILIPPVLIGGITFDVAISILSVIALNELLNFNKDLTIYNKIVPSALTVFIIISERFNIELDKAISFSMLLMFIPIIFLDKDKYDFNKASYLFLNVMLIGFPFSLIRNIRFDDINLFLYLYLIAVTSDTFAYLIGRFFGKRKLIEKVSPNKTYEGFLAGLIASMVICSMFYMYFVDPACNLVSIIIQIAILSVFSLLGDLFFSQIKRLNNVKDYSNIFPGHGGVLDRFDSFIFVVIAYTIIMIFF